MLLDLRLYFAVKQKYAEMCEIGVLMFDLYREEEHSSRVYRWVRLFVRN